MSNSKDETIWLETPLLSVVVVSMIQIRALNPVQFMILSSSKLVNHNQSMTKEYLYMFSWRSEAWEPVCCSSERMDLASCEKKISLLEHHSKTTGAGGWQNH